MKELNLDYYTSEENFLLGLIFDRKFRHLWLNKDYSSEYYKNNKQERIEYQKNYLLTKNGKKTYKKYRNKKLKTDISFKILTNLRNRINMALKRNTKSVHTLQLIGCSIEFLKKHLEKQFNKGMTWDNYGKYGWHIDHIQPCVFFDLSKKSEQLKCFNYTNLRPLWAKDNLLKGAKLCHQEI